jgi:hypothetical protein
MPNTNLSHWSIVASYRKSPTNNGSNPDKESYNTKNTTTAVSRKYILLILNDLAFRQYERDIIEIEMKP